MDSELRNPFSSPDGICLDYIDKLALIELENNKIPRFVYLSMDLYAALQNSYSISRRYPIDDYGMNMMVIYTSAGSLDIISVPGYTNFCHVGSETSFDQIEWVRINKEFESIFFGDHNG